MKSRWGAIALSFACVSLALDVGAEEPAPLDARAIVTLVQTFYDQTQTLQATFQQTRYTRLYDRYDRASGTVVFKKPGKMRWDYEKPNGQVFVSVFLSHGAG